MVCQECGSWVWADRCTDGKCKCGTKFQERGQEGQKGAKLGHSLEQGEDSPTKVTDTLGKSITAIFNSFSEEDRETFCKQYPELAEEVQGVLKADQKEKTFSQVKKEHKEAQGKVWALGQKKVDLAAKLQKLKKQVQEVEQAIEENKSELEAAQADEEKKQLSWADMVKGTIEEKAEEEDGDEEMAEEQGKEAGSIVPEQYQSEAWQEIKKQLTEEAKKELDDQIQILLAEARPRKRANTGNQGKEKGKAGEKGDQGSSGPGMSDKATGALEATAKLVEQALEARAKQGGSSRPGPYTKQG